MFIATSLVLVMKLRPERNVPGLTVTFARELLRTFRS